MNFLIRPFRCVEVNPSKTSVHWSHALIAFAAVGILISVRSPLMAQGFAVSGTIPVGSGPNQVVMTPDGSKVYVSNGGDDTVSVIGTLSNTVIATIPVGSQPAQLAVSPDGSRVYVGNEGGGVSVISTATNSVIATVGTSGYPVRDIAITADGSKVYVALEGGGLGRILTSTNSFSVISSVLCPEGVITSGSLLYVNYQCGGPGGTGGHDAVGVFDVASDSLLTSITGLPNVGASVPRISPNGAQLWENGSDACESNGYDHVGCPATPGVPEGVINVIDTGSNSRVQSLGFSTADSPGSISFFPSGLFVFAGGSTLKIIDTGSFATVGAVPIPASGSVVFAGDGIHAYAPVPSTNSVAVLAALTRITVSTNPPGLKILLDGSESTAPQSISWIAGSNHTVGVASPQAAGTGIQYSFASWSDGGAQTHTITVPSAATNYTANFNLQYLLTATVQPGNAGFVTFNPSSPYGYYNSGSSVQLTATANSGFFQFSNWSGDLSGNANPQSLTMNSPKNVTANFTAATCMYGLSPGSASFGKAASTGNTVTVTLSGSCSTLNATSPVNWVVITGLSGNSGTSIVTYNVLANPSSASRSAMLTIGGQPLFPITQAGQGCLFGLTPSGASMGVNGGNGSFNVTLSGADCAWSVTGNPTWVTNIVGGGTGNGSVSYSVLGNQASNVSRNGTIALSTSSTQASFAITEAGENCSYSLQQASQAFASAGGSGTATVAAPGGCAWTASNANAPWVTITAGGTGSGNGTVSFTVPPNSSTASLTGALTIAGQPYNVTQAAGASASCTALTATFPQAALEGRTELLGDLVLTCTGLSSAVTADIALTLNTNVTNTLSGTDTLDALLVNGNTTQNGQIDGYNVVRWTGVTMGPDTATLRITNVRADASLLGTAGNLQPAAVTGQVSVNTGSALPVSYTGQSAGCGAPVTNAEIMACAGPTLVFQKGQAAPATGGGQTSPLVYQEATAAAFQSGATATRFRLVLSKVPGTVQVYAPVYPNEGTSFAQLYSADPNGLGGTPVVGSPLAGGTYQQLTVSGGSATATWVVLSANASQIEKWTFPLLVTNASNSDLNTIQIGATLGPVSDVSVASATAPVPRYRDFSVPQKLVNLRISIVTAAGPAGSAAAALLAGSAKVLPRDTKSTVISTITLTNDTSDPTQTATNVKVKGDSSGAVIVGCTLGPGTTGLPCTDGDENDYQSLGAGQSQTFTFTEQYDPGTTSRVDTSVNARADQGNADLSAATAASSFASCTAPSCVSITVNTVPAGIKVTQDGDAGYPSPTAYTWTPGTPHTLSVPQQGIPVADNRTTYVLLNWEDNTTSPTRTIPSAPSTPTTYTATYKVSQYLLQYVAIGGGTVTGPQAGTYVNAGTSVTLNAVPTNANFSFSKWTDDLNGNGNTLGTATTLTFPMDSPKDVTAVFVQGGTPVATMNSPPPGSILTGTGVTFSWNPGTNAARYWLDVGNGPLTGEYTTGALSAASKTVSGLPCDGRTLYVSLYTMFNGAADYTRPPQQYTYAASTGCPTSATMISPTPGTTLPGMSVTFSWNATSNAARYWLDVGNGPLTGEYTTGAVTTTSKTVSGLPCDGRTLYVSLYTMFNGAADYTRPPQFYTYAASSGCPTVATMSFPTPGTTLSGTSVTFSWNAGTNAAGYWLDVGNASLPGAYTTGALTTTSKSVYGLPCDGRTLYVSLYTMFNGAADYTRPPQHYTYTASSGCPNVATMSSPPPGTTLTGTSVTFSWNAGTNTAGYWLDVGNGPLTGEYTSGALSATSKTVSGLPCDGRTLYVSLYTMFNGAADYTRPPQQYTYTACRGGG